MNNHRRITSPWVFVAPLCYLVEFILLLFIEQSHSFNAVIGALWTIGQVGIIVTVYKLYKETIADQYQWKIIGMVITTLGALAYSVNYIFGYWLNMNTRLFLPLGALLTGIGMMITGIQVLYGRRWMGVKRFTPLLVGLYPFVVMFPLLVITGHPDLNAIMLWCIPWFLLGLSLRKS